MYRTDPRVLVPGCPDTRQGFTVLAAAYEQDKRYTEAALARERAAIGFDAVQIRATLNELMDRDLARIAGWLDRVADNGPVSIHTEGIDLSDCPPMELTNGRWDDIEIRCATLIARVRLLQRIECGVAAEEKEAAGA